ncbi:hypothetical protein SLT36_11945 [Aminobacter sp. BA135]|uniref:hypothetical protein n=1 Tax=Aminobacter sp. BA135 TaxID=537596 RepID=UPI003D79E3AF
MKQGNYSAADRSKILAAYRELQDEIDRIIRQEEETGVPGDWPNVEDFAAHHGISRSTLYRWLSTERKKPRAKREDTQDLSDVNRSIDLLLSTQRMDWETVVSAMNFSAWLVFPRSQENRCARTLSLAATRIGHLNDQITFDLLGVDIKAALSRFISVGLLRQLSSADDTVVSGEHGYFAHYGTKYTDRDILRAIGRNFLDASDANRPTSINKIEGIFASGDALSGISIAPSQFASLWKEFAPTLPFLCAEADVGIDWHLPLEGSCLDEHLDNLLGISSQVAEFFRVAESYCGRFRRNLDRRAWARLVMPEFPLR